MSDPGSTHEIWIPSSDRVLASDLWAFGAYAAETHGIQFTGYESLHEWSVRAPDRFWAAIWSFTGVLGNPGERVVETTAPFWATRFFPDATINFAENLLRPNDDSAAILFAREDGARSAISWSELHELVARIQDGLRRAGVGRGDRVAAWMSNIPEAIALMLACAGIGAIFSSCSPDFGVQGVVDRFGQIQPVVLVGVDGYVYQGKIHDCRDGLAVISSLLPTVRTTVVIGYIDLEPDLSSVRGSVSWTEWLPSANPGGVEVASLPFDHPLYVLYSSGTTGLPKCIVHRAGGVLMKHLVEHRIHCDVKPGDRVFYFTTTGWMMWNWLASVLATAATTVLYDGSPSSNGGVILWDLVDEFGITLFGTSAKYLDSCRQRGLRPGKNHDFATMRTITSTGSPLAVEGFEYVYEHVKPDVHLASISGGTDLCGCLVAGDPTSPVWPGEIQRPGLGMAIDVFDDDGRSLPPGQGGELVCTAPFPSMPLGFWNDPGDHRYRAAYFERFPEAWHQGDFAAWTDHGGIIIYGRSDATLNPGGVRIGTAEIYRHVEALDEVIESLAVGQDWRGDVRIVLFVVLAEGHELTDELAREIRHRIRKGASPRHVPAHIIAVTDLPRTRSGKLVELAVRDVLNDLPVKNVEALANPEALEQFRALEILRR
jgi:acetoacetyl-CoA synthetase